jgi:tRNA (adenine22-N1)-methyltransferase
MNITSRLLCVASFVRESSVVADIGTDHAYLPIYLVQSGCADKAFACDVKKAPLQLAEKNINEHNLTDKIKTILSNGLLNVPLDVVGDIVIAGMGGILIRDIICDSLDIVQNANLLILQPMNAVEVIRKWLYENGFDIIEEDLAGEGRKISTAGRSLQRAAERNKAASGGSRQNA